MTDTRAKVLTGVLLALLLGAVFLAVHVGAAITPTGHEYSWNVFQLGGDMVMRGTPWPPAATPAAIVAALLVLALFTVLLSWRARRASNKRANVAIENMATKQERKVLLEKARTAETKQLHPAVENMPCGQQVGRVIGTTTWAYQGWRETGVYVFGTGRGKTSSLVIRHCLNAPGAVIMTSNKVDGVREIIAGRSSKGTIYLFDPNRIYRDETAPDFVFNPLDGIDSLEDAQELAGIFEASTRSSEDRGGDAQFDTDGRDLLAAFFLAAALDHLTLATVYEWLADNVGRDAQVILREHGMAGPARTVDGVLNAPDKTRGSVFTTARRMASALANDRLLTWTEGDSARRFDPAAFVTSTDALVLLSKDGAGSGGALLTALVRAVGKRAERIAQRNGGRLPVPLVMELDECANIVKWPELPSLYSFYGSMGIVLNAYFQSRAQGVRAFGRDGWQALWDAAANRVYGGGVADDEFLASLAKLIGKRDDTTWGTSTNRDGDMSSSTHIREVNTMDIDKLANLPEWQVVMFNSKCRPVILTTLPWFRDRELKARITEPAAKAA